MIVVDRIIRGRSSDAYNTDNTDANATSESNTPNAAEFVKAVASKTKRDVSVKFKEAIEHSKKGVILVKCCLKEKTKLGVSRQRRLQYSLSRLT